MTAPGRILLVDDDPAVLDGIRRVLRGRFDLAFCVGGAAAIEALARPDAGFQVVVSDLSMPGVTGIRVLAEASRLSPDTVRILLTGQADLQAAITAVNEGRLFRFLTKPCPPEVLAGALGAALEQYRLVTAERELLERTLAGSVRVMTETLALASPRIFGRAQRLRRIVRHAAERAGLRPAWPVELAALLMHLGAVNLPPDLLDRLDAGSDQPADEPAVQAGHRLAAGVIAHIPRLDEVARIVAAQAGDALRGDLVPARLLALALRFERQLSAGDDPPRAVGRLREGLPADLVPLLDAFDGFDPGAGLRPRTIQPREFAAGMVLGQDLRARDGTLLVARGQEVGAALLARLAAVADRLPAHIHVYAP
ncbi:MAG: hypothetical protein RLZZ127_203 [Planctomycetota bacterium]|jgi:response regulator RpfG family c-di-GMP phosphodiesterase